MNKAIVAMLVSCSEILWGGGETGILVKIFQHKIENSEHNEAAVRVNICERDSNKIVHYLSLARKVSIQLSFGGERFLVTSTNPSELYISYQEDLIGRLIPTYCDSLMDQPIHYPMAYSFDRRNNRVRVCLEDIQTISSRLDRGQKFRIRFHQHDPVKVSKTLDEEFLIHEFFERDLVHLEGVKCRPSDEF